MSLRSGAAFAGYTIVRLLGSGGMGEVYLAQHPRLPRRDALKILSSDVSADDDYRNRFIREANLAAELWHPNIVRVNDRGEFNGQLWISMDFVDGTDAASLLRNRYPDGLPAEEVVKLISAVAKALDYAHQHGLLHRDVKPANILLSNPKDGDQRILLGDFGIARNVGDISGLTLTNMTIGTLPYAAPEQLRGEPIDGRADQYALAATAYHLLAGSLLFPQSNPAVVIGHHLNTPPAALADTRPDLAAFDPVLATALAKDPVGRFSSCTEFARELAEAAQRLPAAATPTMEAPVTSKPSAITTPSQTNSVGSHKQMLRWRPRSRVLLGAALAVVLLIAVGVIGYLNLLKHGTKSTSPAAPAHVLDGTYRLVYDSTKQTFNGAPVSQPNDSNVTWWAFRSLCTPTGCVATGTGLDPTNPQVPRTPGYMETLHFVGDHWQQTQATPERTQEAHSKCLGVDGKLVAGSQTVTKVMSLEPQSDGALRGTTTSTVLTNECGNQGSVNEIPFVATRTGDRPPGVTVAEPANVPAASATTSSPRPPAGGPVLDGAYRLDFDDTHQTINGNPITGGSQETHWWAFRSVCTPTRCVATGASLSDNNQQEPAGGAIVFAFNDGHWQNTPTLQDEKSCDIEYSGGAPLGGTAGDTNTKLWSLAPQPDGTLKGTAKTTVISNECGFKGSVFSTPIIATRIGDVPSSVVLADPTLF